MKPLDHYSEEAVQLFKALDIDMIRTGEKCTDNMPAHSWMHVNRSMDKPDAQGLYLPLPHGSPTATLISARMIMGKPEFIFPNVSRLSAVQAIEVKARSMLIGDILAWFTEMTHDGMLPPLREGEDFLVTTRNPYWYMINDVLRIAEENVPDIAGIRSRLPSQCNVSFDDDTKPPQESYLIDIKIEDDAVVLRNGGVKRESPCKVMVGVALADKPFVPDYDLSAVKF